MIPDWLRDAMQRESDHHESRRKQQDLELLFRYGIKNQTREITGGGNQSVVCAGGPVQCMEGQPPDVDNQSPDASEGQQEKLQTI